MIRKSLSGMDQSGWVNVENLVYPYRFALFIDKEGFWPLLERAKIAGRYDLAILSTKGMSNTAARMLLEALADENVTILVTHDFDKSGLAQTFPALTKGILPFRLAIPETFISVFRWALMSTLPEARAARCPAGRFRCKSCDPDRTSGNHAAIYR